MIKHFEKDSNCNDTGLMLLRWISISNKALKAAKKLIDPIILIFENRINDIIRKYRDVNKRDDYLRMIKKSMKSDFSLDKNLNEYLSKFHPSSIQPSDREDTMILTRKG